MHQRNRTISRPPIVGLAGAAALLVAAMSLPSRAVEAPAKRIVAVGGVVTEIVYALGRQDLIVGVDSTSQFPAVALKEKRDIGYVRALSAEGVLSLTPDRVLAIDGAGPPDALKLIRAAGITVTTLPEDLSEAGVLARIRMVGGAIGMIAAAEALAASVEARFMILAAERARIAAPRRVLLVLSMQNGRVMVGGRNTSAAAIIALAGGINAAEAVEGFKPLSDEGLIAAAPDVIVMMQRGDHATSADEVFAHPAFRLVPAAKARALVSMDGLYLLGFGPRAPEAALDLMMAVHPEHPGAARRRAEMPQRLAR